jgi:hypothetical protein
MFNLSRFKIESFAISATTSFTLNTNCKFSQPISDLLQQELDGYNLYLAKRTIKTTPMRLTKLLGLLLPAVLLAACSGQQETVPIELNDLEFTLEGPLFEGPNQGQYVVQVDLPALLGADDLEVRSARLSSATVLPNDSLGFANVRSFVLSLASDNPEVGMVEAAFLNPLGDAATQAELSVSKEADATAFFQGSTFYLVLDADFAADFEGNRSFKANLVFDVVTK